MKIIYFECKMGAAGDMLMASLLELIDPADAESFIDEMNNLALAGVHVKKSQSIKCGICGTHVDVHIHGKTEKSHDHDHSHSHDHEHSHDHDHSHDHEHSHDHSHSGLAEIAGIIDGLTVSQAVKDNANAIYKIIADAESHVHGCPVSEIHFHEVGTLDAIADIVGVCMLMERLSPDAVFASPIHVGSGSVYCAHGILPVPAPATAYILQGVPIYSGKISAELCTPTGAAVLKHFANKFCAMPEMVVNRIGYGMGTKDFDAANCVRTFIGETL